MVQLVHIIVSRNKETWKNRTKTIKRLHWKETLFPVISVSMNENVIYVVYS